MNYKIGDTFNKSYTEDVSKFCNNNFAYIEKENDYFIIKPLKREGFVYDYEKECWVENKSELLEIKKTNKVNDLLLQFNSEVEKGFIHTQNEIEYNFYCSKSTLELIQFSAENLKDIEALGETPTSIDLCFDDRNLNTCEFADTASFIAFKVAITRHIDLLDKNRNCLKKAIMNATTEQELESIDLTEGW